MVPRLQMNNISKSFPGVQALKEVNLEVLPGEVHVLVGENGAGKSTLAKILAGIYQCDSGSIKLDGQQIHINNTEDANKLGIYIIHQELNLVPELSIAENIYLGRDMPKRKYGLINWESLYASALCVLEQLSFSINPKIQAKYLSVAQQQMIEIAKVISEQEPKIIIMDEPTAALTEKETNELFKQIRRLAQSRVSIIYISHRLEEINLIGDRITIMRDGQVVGEALRVSDLTKRQVIKMMVGRDIENQYPKKIYPVGNEILRVENISSTKSKSLASFSLYRGEVLGFAGLIGSGRTELMRSIFGADKRAHGIIYKDGKQIKINSPFDAVCNNIAFLTEDRKQTGLLLNQPICYNISLANIIKFLKFGFINHSKEILEAKKYIANLDIKPPQYYILTNNLSGGNQQKVIFARWLCKNADVIILDEPTRGIDVNAKVEIYEIINLLAQAGKGIILISSDLPEIIGMSDRIIVMCEGNITGILKRENFSQEKIMELAVKSANEFVGVHDL